MHKLGLCRVPTENEEMGDFHILFGSLFGMMTEGAYPGSHPILPRYVLPYCMKKKKLSTAI
jgi:hypothetical protein